MNPDLIIYWFCCLVIGVCVGMATNSIALGSAAALYIWMQSPNAPWNVDRE